MEVNIFWLILSTLVGVVVTYLTTYTNAKAQFQAELETKAKMTEEQERVISQYRLDSEKRKYQYERKHEVYSKYHNLLDRFDGDKNPLLDNAKLDFLLSEMLNKMSVNRGDEGESMKAFNVFANEIKKMIREALAGIKDIAKQTNELKLIAPSEINTLLDRINENYLQIEKISSPIFKDPVKMLTGNVDFSPINNEIDRINSETKEIKAKLIEMMRADIEVI